MIRNDDDDAVLSVIMCFDYVHSYDPQLRNRYGEDGKSCFS